VLFHPYVWMRGGGGLRGAQRATVLTKDDLAAYAAVQARRRAERNKKNRRRGRKGHDDDEAEEGEVGDEEEDAAAKMVEFEAQSVGVSVASSGGSSSSSDDDDADIFAEDREGEGEGEGAPPQQQQDQELVGVVRRTRARGDPRQWDIREYREQIEVPGDTGARVWVWRFRFPARVWDITRFFQPNVLVFAAFPELQESDAERARYPAFFDDHAAQVSAFLRAVTAGPHLGRRDDVREADSLARLAEANAAELQRQQRGLSPEDQLRVARAFRKDPLNLAAAWRALRECGTVRVQGLVDWIVQQQRAAQRLGKRFSLFAPDALQVADPGLDPLGNFLIQFHEEAEQHFSLKAHHHTVALMWFAALSCLDPDSELRLNVLLTGPPGIGKSYVLDLVIMLLVRASVLELSSFTPKAFEADDHQNRIDRAAMAMDEVPHRYLGVDQPGKRPEGQGDPFLKTLMTKSWVSMMHNVASEDGRGRTSRYIEKACRMAVLAATNVGAFVLPRPVRSRTALRDCLDIVRDGHDIDQKLLHEAFRRGGLQLSPEARRWAATTQRVQVLVFLVEALIQLHLMEPPSLMTVRLCLGRMLRKLRHEGVDVTARRDFLRMMTLARDCCIVRAVLSVFFSWLLLPRDKELPEFTLEHVQLVQPLLVGSYQDAVYAFTALVDQYVRPEEALPFQALALETWGYDAKPGAPAPDLAALTAKGAFEGEAREYLVFKNVKPIEGQLEAGLAARAAQAMAAQSARFASRLGAESIESIVRELAARRFRGKPVVQLDGASRTVGVNRAWLDASFTKKFEDVVLEAVRCVHEKHMPRTRVVTALSYADDPEAMMPHLLRVVALEPNPRHVWATPKFRGMFERKEDDEDFKEEPDGEDPAVWTFGERDAVVAESALYLYRLGLGLEEGDDVDDDADAKDVKPEVAVARYVSPRVLREELCKRQSPEVWKREGTYPLTHREAYIKRFRAAQVCMRMEEEEGDDAAAAEPRLPPRGADVLKQVRIPPAVLRMCGLSDSRKRPNAGRDRRRRRQAKDALEAPAAAAPAAPDRDENDDPQLQAPRTRTRTRISEEAEAEEEEWDGTA
jgi:hypothetical protein